ncbi:MAG: RES family NAD+ phosphorylase [Burkholderiaceae bacterium]|nr:RES family NAD+ phosphorylase [Burkholderiaceae bacterium]
MKVWRIATENKKYQATDLSGFGAKFAPGRWNELGLPVIYTASTPSLAMLETTAHVDHNDLPQLKYLISIEIPAADWKQRRQLLSKQLPAGWDSIPHENITVAIGSDWLRGCSSLVLTVPSAITPEETVILINPAHSKASKLKATKIRAVDYKTVLRSTK